MAGQAAVRILEVCEGEESSIFWRARPPSSSSSSSSSFLRTLSRGFRQYGTLLDLTWIFQSFLTLARIVAELCLSSPGSVSFRNSHNRHSQWSSHAGNNAKTTRVICTRELFSTHLFLLERLFSNYIKRAKDVCLTQLRCQVT
jgi:hypothetical protein